MTFLNTTAQTIPDIVQQPPMNSLAQSHPTLLSFSLAMLTFHTLSFIFHIIDRRAFLQKHKIFHPTPHTPSYLQMLPRVLFNQLFILLPSMALVAHLDLAYTNLQYVNPPRFSASVLAFVTLPPLLHELIFYLAHRFILHSRWGFIALDHAMHHTTKAHSAISAMYMSSLDFLLEIVIPYLTPLILLSQTNLLTPLHCVLMLPFGALGGLYEHSGYNFFADVPVLDARVHGLHHLYYHCSFADGVGAPSVLDAIFGTVCSNVGVASSSWKQLFAWLVPEHRSQNGDQQLEPQLQ